MVQSLTFVIALMFHASLEGFAFGVQVRLVAYLCSGFLLGFKFLFYFLNFYLNYFYFLCFAAGESQLVLQLERSGIVPCVLLVLYSIALYSSFSRCFA